MLAKKKAFVIISQYPTGVVKICCEQQYEKDALG
jgi:hypothetical protein